jgi:hypothetical protein
MESGSGSVLRRLDWITGTCWISDGAKVVESPPYSVVRTSQVPSNDDIHLHLSRWRRRYKVLAGLGLTRCIECL